MSSRKACPVRMALAVLIGVGGGSVLTLLVPMATCVPEHELRAATKLRMTQAEDLGLWRLPFHLPFHLP